MSYPVRARLEPGIPIHANRFAVLQDEADDRRTAGVGGTAGKRLAAERPGIRFADTPAPYYAQVMNEICAVRLHAGNVSGQFPDFLFAHDRGLADSGYRTPYATIDRIVEDLRRAGVAERVGTYDLTGSRGVEEWANNVRAQNYASGNVFLFGPSRGLSASVDDAMDGQVLPLFRARLADPVPAGASALSVAFPFIVLFVPYFLCLLVSKLTQRCDRPQAPDQPAAVPAPPVEPVQHDEPLTFASYDAQYSDSESSSFARSSVQTSELELEPGAQFQAPGAAYEPDRNGRPSRSGHDACEQPGAVASAPASRRASWVGGVENTL